MKVILKLNMQAGVAAFYLSLFLFLLTGCTGRLRKHRDAALLLVPAGVDSTVAQQADSLADGLFVSLDREARADQHKKLGKVVTTKSDTLWRYLANELEPSFQ